MTRENEALRLTPSSDETTVPPGSTGLTRRRLLTSGGVAFVALNVGVSAAAHADPRTTAPTALAGGGARLSAWGGYANGYIPASALTAIPWNTARRLRTDAANALIALNDAYRGAFGRDLVLNDAYRDFAGQVEARNYWCGQGNCGFAAVPGTSNHGWAVAIDIGVKRTDWTNPTYVWMKTNAPGFGWTHPAWAEPGGAHPEAWHWEYTGAFVPTPTPEEEMAIEDLYTTFSKTGGQSVAVNDNPNLHINDLAHVSVASGVAKHITGNLTITVTGGTPGGDFKVFPIVWDASTNVESSLGSQEIVFTAGESISKVPVNCALTETQRLKFRVGASSTAFSVKNAVFRGAKLN